MANPSADENLLVVCTMGHACDYVHEPRKIIPPGCKYITIEICGMYSIDLPKIYIAFRDKLLREALKYPEHPEIWTVLNEYLDFASGNAVLRVRTEGMHYTDSKIELWCPAGSLYFKSGIYQLGRVPNGEPGDIPGGQIAIAMKEGEIEVKNPYDMDPVILNQLYFGSLVNNPSQVNSSRIMETLFKKSQSSSAAELPVVLYQLACRALCNPAVTTDKQLKMTRQNSSNQMTAKRLYHQLGPGGRNSRPHILRNQPRRVSFNDLIYKWNAEHISNEERRRNWYERIQGALDEIKNGKVYTSPTLTAVAAKLRAEAEAVAGAVATAEAELHAVAEILKENLEKLEKLKATGQFKAEKSVAKAERQPSKTEIAKAIPKVRAELKKKAEVLAELKIIFEDYQKQARQAEESASSSSAKELSASEESASASSQTNVLPNYVNAPASAAASSSSSSSSAAALEPIAEENSNAETDYNEESSIRRIHNEDLVAAATLSGLLHAEPTKKKRKGGKARGVTRHKRSNHIIHNKHKTYRKKANQRTHKRK